MHKGRIAFAAAVAAAALTLTACGGDDDTQASAPTSDTAATSATSPATSSAPSESPAAGGDTAPGDVTAPGTTLKVGDRAVLPYEYTKDKKGTIAVTVTAIEKGTESDMAPFGDRAKGMTPYFIKLRVENVGGTDLSYSSLKLRGLLEDGKSTGVVLIGGIPGKCDNKSAPRDFTTAGASYETCSLSATTSAPITAAEFSEGDDYSDNSVVWQS
ncbi:hypothetical protein ACFWQL_26975 [Amycolatopsis thermoflava]|uniref:hypothetical protein n=1 Tax=Amycolatopsis thermoflava TaxID=84480 RepID=UPI00364DEE92